jgi:polyhydroxybutyrate depolymerase
MRPWTLLAPLLACGPVVDDEASTDALVEAPACTPDVDCLDAGVQRFVSGGENRRVTVLLPDEPRGAPVVFAWHYLGGSPDELITWMQLERVAEAGYIVVVPKSRGLAGTEWDVYDRSDNNVDLALYDDLRDAVLTYHQADPDRLYVTGFSAGALFTTWLTMHRGADLAASAPFSGGTPAVSYTTPDKTFPVMVTWGGPSDVYAGFSFDTASRAFASGLADDGHEVVTCEHTRGHQLPANATDALLTFLGGDTPEARTPEGCEEVR